MGRTREATDRTPARPRTERPLRKPFVVDVLGPEARGKVGVRVDVVNAVPGMTCERQR